MATNKKASSTVKRFKTNIGAMKKQAAKVREEAANRGNIDTQQFKASNGSNLVRILPPWSEEGFFYKDYWVHFIETTDNEGKSVTRPVLCIQKEQGKKCPACEYRAQLNKSSDESDKELAKKFRYSHRYTMQIIDQNNPDKGILLWSVSAKMMEEILKWFEKEDWGDITDPEEGYDLEFTRTGKGMLDTKYSAPTPATKNPTELDDWETLLEDLIDLDEFVGKMKLSFKEFEALLQGEDLEDEEDEEEEDEQDEDEDEEDAPEVSEKDSDDEEDTYTKEELEEFEDDELVEIAEDDFEIETKGFFKGKGSKKKLNRDAIIEAILEEQGDLEGDDEEPDFDSSDVDDLEDEDVPFNEEQKGDSKKGSKKTSEMASSLKNKLNSRRKK